MSHMIDETTGRAAIAFRGEKPWHGLGFEIGEFDDVDTIRAKAGLGWDCMSSPVMYRNGELHTMANRKVLFRSDTGAALSVVADGYKPVQPQEIVDFMKKVVEVGGYSIETAGALSDGKRIWMLAKVNDGVEIVPGDVVKPYLLLATSYDATMATVGKHTCVRVVCNNTISVAIDTSRYARAEAGEIRVPHSATFDADAMRAQLNVGMTTWDKFRFQAGIMAHKAMSVNDADAFLLELLTPLAAAERRTPELVRDSRGYGKIMALFQGGAMGSELAAGTQWQALNAVTEYVDHERGRSANSRIESAWFGQGDALKSRALELLAA